MSDYLKQLQLIHGLTYPRPTKMWITSKNWALLAKELQDAGKMPTTGNFQSLQVGVNKATALTVINSGTESQEVCNDLNRPEEVASMFREKHDAYAVPKGTKPSVEWVDAESTHEFPEELRLQVQDKLRKKYNTTDIEVVR